MKKKIPLLSLAIIWLLFLISPISNSLSHALKDDTTTEPLSESSREQEITLVGFDVIGLRKMGNGRKRVTMKRIMRKEITTTNINDDDEREELDEQSSRISGANNYDRTCNFEAQKGEFGGKNMVVKNCKNAAKKLNVAGFVTFGADYKGPLHHPPKHN